MIHTTINYKVEISYSFNPEQLPNLSFLTTRKLKENLIKALKLDRMGNSLGTDEVSVNYVEVL